MYKNYSLEVNRKHRKPVKIVTLDELEITWTVLTTNVGSGMPSDGSMLEGFS